MAQRIGGDPLGALPDWPSYQTAALRGTKTLIKIVPIGDPGQIALVFTLNGCSYTTWIGPGITVQEARHYAASF